MITYYKATRLNGTDFRTGTVRYADALANGHHIEHGVTESAPGEASTYLSVATDPVGTLLGGEWPCRLFRVEPLSGIRQESAHRFKVACSSLRVVEELNPTLALGPNGAEVAAFIEAIPGLIESALGAARGAAWDAARSTAWNAARDAARDAAGHAARDAARDAAWDVAGDAAGYAAGDAARSASWDAVWDAVWYATVDVAGALLTKDLISGEHFNTLMRPWRILTGEES